MLLLLFVRLLRMFFIVRIVLAKAVFTNMAEMQNARRRGMVGR